MEVGKQMVDLGTPEFVCISVQTVDFVVSICKSRHMLYISLALSQYKWLIFQYTLPNYLYQFSVIKIGKSIFFTWLCWNIHFIFLLFQARYLLFFCARQTLSNALKLLGIPPMKKV